MSVPVPLEITEQSTGYLTVSFYDKAGALAVPASATYRIDDVVSGSSVRAATALTPASTIEITLTKQDNTILNDARRDEQRRVTIISVYSSTDQVTDEYIYGVRNLAKVP